MKVLISGAHGLVGSALKKALAAEGHDLLALVRRQPRSDAEIQWSPHEPIVSAKLEGLDAVVHLAGESIAEGRWTDAKKQRIRDSRVKATELLSRALANLKAPPKTLVCASAIGYYGDRGDEILTEQSAPGKDFLAGVCVDWEKATTPAAEKGIRVVNARLGVVLSAEGGALQKMLPPFRMGIGGRVGDGKQWMSWIALADVVGVLKLSLIDESLQGPINVVATSPVTNAEFTKTLGRVLSRPTLFPVPAFGVRLMFGEMADALLLSSQRVDPHRLKEAGFAFQYSKLEPALRHILAQSN